MRAALFLLMMILSPSALIADAVVKVRPGSETATPQAAQLRVRELREAGEQGAIRVEFAGGEYFLSEPWTLTHEDSGKPGGATLYTTAPGEKVLLTGGRKATGWEPAGEGLWRAKAEGKFEQMWINGRRAVRARTPNALELRPGAVPGYFNAKGQAREGLFPDLKRPSFEAFVARPEDYAVLKKIPEEERGGVLLTVLQTWTAGLCRIQALNDEANGIRIAGATRYPFVEFEPDQRWYVENFRAALDSPGEWYHTPGGELLYYPHPGEDMRQAEVVLPATEKLLILDGADHVRFENLSFAHTQHLFGPVGHHDGQAAAGVGAAIELDRSRWVTFENCEVRHTGGYALWFRTGCSGCQLLHSILEDLGGGGVRIGDTKMPDETALTHHIQVDDCIIQGGGRLFASACGIFLAHASDCEVTHCDIGDFYYTGISAGWVWGYKHSPSKRNRFDYNHIHHLGSGVLSDMGGFYGLGRSEGTTVSHNHVHDVASYRYGGWGLYTDEGSTGITLSHNVVHDTSESTFHQHYGKWNQVSHNVFAFGRKAQIQRSRPEKHASFAYENNIVIYDVPKLLDGTQYNWGTGTYEMRNNLYWNTAGQPVRFLEDDLPAWQQKTGLEEGSLIADPLFVNVKGRDFRLKKESPAWKLGFEQGDITKAGVRGQEWRKRAWMVIPDFWEKSKPWPMPPYAIEENFENMGLGFPAISRQEIHWQNKGDGIQISEDQAASGRRSLKITDAPGLDPSWDPHYVLKPGYKSGTVRLSFQVRMEKGARFFTEFRSAGQPYLSGPYLAFENGRILARQGKVLCALPEDTWAKVEMTVPLAGEGAGRWQLRVTRSGQVAETFTDLPCQEGWNELAWLGFVSTAKDKTAFWLDDLTLSAD